MILDELLHLPVPLVFFTDKMRMVIVPSSWNYENSGTDINVHQVMSLHVLACRLSISSDVLAAGAPQPGMGTLRAIGARAMAIALVVPCCQ